MADNQVSANMVGTALAFALSFITTMFYFGLYEAGKLMESPVAEMLEDSRCGAKKLDMMPSCTVAKSLSMRSPGALELRFGACGCILSTVTVL